MPGRISDSDIALVRERSPIADIVGEHLQLRNAGGGSLKGLCPFHEEKTPSFHVTPARGFFHCFGCGVGGDVISFVQQIDHLSFTEAIERLAARSGVELHYEQGGSAPALAGCTTTTRSRPSTSTLLRLRCTTRARCCTPSTVPSVRSHGDGKQFSSRATPT